MLDPIVESIHLYHFHTFRNIFIIRSPWFLLKWYKNIVWALKEQFRQEISVLRYSSLYCYTVTKYLFALKMKYSPEQCILFFISDFACHVLAPRPSHTATLIESVTGTENSPSSSHKIEKKMICTRWRGKNYNYQRFLKKSRQYQ